MRDPKSKSPDAPRDSGQSPPRVAVLILNWNGRELTIDCLRSLMTVETPNVELILVDNGSTDGSVEAIRDRFGERVTVIANKQNLGFAGGNNAGIRHALDTGADFVLLLNNDTVVDAALIDYMLQPFADDPRVGITGPKIYYYTPRDQIWFAGGRIFLARGTSCHVGIRQTDTGQYDRRTEIDYVTGCALMASRAVFESCGLLDPSYVAYYEDADFCMRARRAGFSIVYEPGGKVWHKISASTGGQMSRRKITRKFKSTWKFFRRYSKPWHWLTIPLFFAADTIRILFMIGTRRIRNAD
jgi:GT2 family glycosyltransferase